MAALLVAIAVLAVLMTVALPAWHQAVQREKEEELIFRGRQYVRAIRLYQRRFAAAYPTDIDLLVKQKFLRKKFQDPMVEDGEFEILYQGSLVSVGQGPGQGRGGSIQGQTPGRGGASQGGQPGFTFDSRSGAITQGNQSGRGAGPRGGMIGVRSKSTEASFRIYNGATHYNEWLFLSMPTLVGPGQVRPGMRIGPGGSGMPGGRGGPGSGPGGADFPSFPGGPGGVRGGRGAQGGAQGVPQPGGRGQNQ